LGVADGAWDGWVEVDAHYDLGSQTIWIDRALDQQVPGHPLTLTLDLGEMGFAVDQAYDIESTDPQTGEFDFYAGAWPHTGKLELMVPRNAQGTVHREMLIYPASGRSLRTLRLQQGAGGYAGTDDTYIVSPDLEGSAAEAPHGGSTTLPLSHDARRRVLVQYELPELSSLAAANVRSALLTLYLTGDRSMPLSVSAYAALRAWDGSTATWTKARSGVLWTSPGAAGPGTDIAAMPQAVAANVKTSGPYVFDVRTLVQQWLETPSTNHGVILIGSGTYSGQRSLFASAEYADSSKRPLLEIEYLDEPLTPTPTRTATSTATATRTAEPTPTITRTATATATATNTALPTASATLTGTATRTPTVTVTATATATPSLPLWRLFLPMVLK